VFFPYNNGSQESLQWLEQESKKHKTHIHHAMCGHGGERHIERFPVDGYDQKTKTVFQYHGCLWHGCPRCYADRDRIITRDNKTGETKTCEQLYQETLKRTRSLRKAGYQMIERWGCAFVAGFSRFKRQTKSYPHAIFYNFEAYLDKNERREVTDALTFENRHVPISVSVGDTLERDPAELIRKFVEELKRKGREIRQIVRKEFITEDICLIAKKQRTKIEEWCDQVPVLRFNSGQHDLNLIKEHFADHLCEVKNKVRVAKKGNTAMFMLTHTFVSLIL